jgi:hypothetical protein
VRLQSAGKSPIQAPGIPYIVPTFIASLVMAIVTLLFPSGVAASASNIYLAQNSAGAANGADCADALPYTFFNSSGNWGSGANQIGPGTTVHLCGIISGKNATSGAGGGGGNVFTFQGSGNSGAPITLHWENGAILEANYFGENNNAAVVINGVSYVVIDGGTNGIIENTANGTSGSTACPSGSCSNQQPATFIQASCVTNCEVKNLTLGPDYLRTSTSDGAPAGFGNEAAIFVGGSSNSNFLIHDNLIHDGRWINTFELGTGSNFQFYNNTVHGAGHQIAVEIGGTYTGIYIYGNHIYDFTPWAGNSAFHNNAIHVFQSGANTSGTILGLYIYNNEFDGSFGGSSTDSIYLEPNGNVNSVGTGWIFNNILTFAGDETGGDGVLGIFAGGTSMFVANNTVICDAADQSVPNEVGMASDQPILGATVANNIVTSCSTIWRAQSPGSPGPTFVSSQPDYNLYAVGIGNGWQWNGGFTTSIGSWRTGIGNETHSAYFSTTPIPACNSIHDCSNVRPTTGSTAIGFAANLSGTCNGQPIPGLGALCYDKPQSIGPGSGSTVGSQRPTTNSWDAGAYASGVTVSQPPAPADLVATVN